MLPGDYASVERKVQPLLVLSAAIEKLELAQAYVLGRLTDVWRCSMSTHSVTRHVSLQTGKDSLRMMI
jgi:hypothetical protein